MFETFKAIFVVGAAVSLVLINGAFHQSNAEGTAKTSENPTSQPALQQSLQQSATGVAAAASAPIPGSSSPAGTDYTGPTIPSSPVTSSSPSATATTKATADSTAIPATQAATRAATPPATGFHELKVRLSGSMCLACLHELQRKLRRIVGVKAAIVMPPLARIQREPAPEKYAEARIIYDTKKLTKEQLKTFMERHDFQPWNLEDFETTAVTLQDDPKLYWKEE